MEIDRSADLLNEIGQLLMADADYPVEPTLLYAEVDQGYVSESIFKELGNQILYRNPVNKRLPYALLELWAAQTETPRWTEMVYLVRHGKFEVTYVYPDEINPDEDLIDRRKRQVLRYFGEKPIVYPPLFEDDDDIFGYTL